MNDDVAGPNRSKNRVLDEVARVLARNPSASMGEIAVAVGVSRSTIHRRFAERAVLIAALQERAADALASASRRARLSEGSAREAILRLCTGYFEAGDLVFAAYGHLTTDQELDSVRTESDRDLVAAIERGHRDGSIDRSLPPLWIEQSLWSLLYTAWLTSAAERTTRHEALTIFLHSLDKMLAPVPTTSPGLS